MKKSFKPVEDEWAKVVEWLEENPYEWQAYSRALLKASDLCWTSYTSDRNFFEDQKIDIGNTDQYLQKVSFFLLGLSVELELKAKARLNPDLASSLDLKTHQLFTLSDGLGIDLNKDEEDLLKALTQYILWKGRYPVSKKPEKDTPQGFELSTEDIRNEIKGLLEKIHSFQPLIKFN